MRVFKHGDALAIVIPQSLVSSSGLNDGDELEFIETERGVFVLLTKEKLSELAKPKVGEAFSKNFEKPFPVSNPVSSVSRFSSGAGASAGSSTERTASTSASVSPPAQEAGRLNSFFRRELDSKGFIVVFEEKGAQDFSRDFEQEIKSGSLVGTRGFDKKFYVATRGFLEQQTPKLLKVLADGPLSLEQLSEKTKIPEDGVKSLVWILMDEGEVIEKKKGFFASA